MTMAPSPYRKLRIAHAYSYTYSLAPPILIGGVSFKNLRMISASASGECETTLPDFDFDEYGFLIPRGDQDGLESRSHEYRCDQCFVLKLWSPVRHHVPT